MPPRNLEQLSDWLPEIRKEALRELVDRAIFNRASPEEMAYLRWIAPIEDQELGEYSNAA